MEGALAYSIVKTSCNFKRESMVIYCQIEIRWRLTDSGGKRPSLSSGGAAIVKPIELATAVA
jgi:hypothetical protein